MHMDSRAPAQLRLFCAACLLLLLPALALFLVNLELAIRVLYPAFMLFERILPGWIYRAGVPFAADLSTISTLVPVMMLAFPLVQGWRVLRAGDRAGAVVREMQADPYPPHFAFFLVMLGLVGTLYGMLIGLQSSGVGSFGSGGPTPESVQVTLDRLIGGTATAILSSLVGIVGAFVVARPVPWLFRRLTGVEQEESRRTLTDTLDGLTRDLQALGSASRNLTSQLQPTLLPDLLKRLDRVETGLQDAVRHLAPLDGHLQHLRQAADQNVAQTARLETVELAVREQSARLDRALEALLKLGGTASQTNELLERRLTEAREQQQALLQPLAAAAAATQEAAREGRTDRESLRRALAQYAGGKD